MLTVDFLHQRAFAAVGTFLTSLIPQRRQQVAAPGPTGRPTQAAPTRQNLLYGDHDDRFAMGDVNQFHPLNRAAQMPQQQQQMPQYPPPDEESITALMVSSSSAWLLSCWSLKICCVTMFYINLQNLGFERDAVVRALQASGNDVQTAANRLCS